MAIGASTFSNLGGAVNDIFSTQASAKGLQIKAQGDIAEGQEYGLAADLARQNAQYTEQSTAIKTMQQQRELSQTWAASRLRWQRQASSRAARRSICCATRRHRARCRRRCSASRV
jgi:hypothetical protein